MLTRTSFIVPAAAVVCLTALALTGCSSGSSTSSGSSSSNSGSSNSAAGSQSGSSAGSTATATFTGDLKGTVTLNLCTDSGVDSVFVKVDGDSTKYVGSVSATQFGFVGPKAVDFAPDHDANATVPQKITTGSGGYTLDGVHAYDLISSPHREIVLSGKVTCP